MYYLTKEWAYAYDALKANENLGEHKNVLAALEKAAEAAQRETQLSLKSLGCGNDFDDFLEEPLQAAQQREATLELFFANGKIQILSPSIIETEIDFSEALNACNPPCFLKAVELYETGKNAYALHCLFERERKYDYFTVQCAQLRIEEP